MYFCVIALRIHMSQQTHNALILLQQGYVMEMRGEINIKVQNILIFMPKKYICHHFLSPPAIIKAFNAFPVHLKII